MWSTPGNLTMRAMPFPVGTAILTPGALLLLDCPSQRENSTQKANPLQLLQVCPKITSDTLPFMFVLIHSTTSCLGILDNSLGSRSRKGWRGFAEKVKKRVCYRNLTCMLWHKYRFTPLTNIEDCRILEILEKREEKEAKRSRSQCVTKRKIRVKTITKII